MEHLLITKNDMTVYAANTDDPQRTALTAATYFMSYLLISLFTAVVTYIMVSVVHLIV